MRKLFTALFFIGLGAGAYWYFTEGRHRADVQEAQKEIAAGAGRMKDALKESFPRLAVRAEEIKEELARTGKVVRQKTRKAGGVIADASITTEIKAKLVADAELPGLKISVNTTDGVVTLSGAVSSEEKIARAMNLALEVEGVREVISTLQVKADR